MPKNIVICCDGTANEFAPDRTNVVKLFYTLVQNPNTQVSYYHPGLGTMEPAGALSPLTRKFTKLLGMALGYGLSSDIWSAYSFLSWSDIRKVIRSSSSASAGEHTRCVPFAPCCICTDSFTKVTKLSYLMRSA